MANETSFTFMIDDNLKTELKMIALKQKKTVKEIVTNLIKEYVEENK